jgi:hypothetical protein
MAYTKKSIVPIYYSNNCSIHDESDSSEVVVDNECDTMPLQCRYKASSPVESNVNKNDDRAGSKADGFVLNLLHNSNDSGNNENALANMIFSLI